MLPKHTFGDEFFNELNKRILFVSHDAPIRPLGKICLLE